LTSQTSCGMAGDWFRGRLLHETLAHGAGSAGESTGVAGTRSDWFRIKRA
jgi:hypothetical protein